jgi:hypothetical protein
MKTGNQFNSKYVLTVLTALVISCASTENAGVLPEDQLFVTRKYVGDFLGYSHSAPETFGGPHLIYIKTTMDSTSDKLSAYSKKCEFTANDRLYIRRTFHSEGGVFGTWMYQIENDSSVYYKVSEFEFEDKVLVQTWY